MTLIAEKNEYTVLIERDEAPMNPCVEYDLLGTMACVHSRYDLGTEQFSSFNDLFLSLLENVKGVESVQALWYDMEDRIFGNHLPTNETQRQFQKEMIERLSQDYVLMPLYLYDHSGLSISTESFHDPWDSGQVGFIYISNEDALQKFTLRQSERPMMNDEFREKMKDLLQNEVTLYNHYLQGDSYGYTLFKNGEETNSCWGFLGDLDSMIDEIEYELPEEFKNLKDLLHEDNTPLVTSVMKASPETKASIFKMLTQSENPLIASVKNASPKAQESIFKILAQNKELVAQMKQKESPLSTRSGDSR